MVKSQIPAVDFDMDGVYELYLNDSKGHTWVITPNGNVATMFDDNNWHLLHDWKVGNVYNESGEMRGCLASDADRDNKPDIYFAENNFASIMDMEYDGVNVTDGNNYSYYLTAIDANDDVDGGHFARASNIALSDMDNDGHLEVTVIVPWTGGAIRSITCAGLYVFEFDRTGVGIVGPSDRFPTTYSLHQNYPNPFVLSQNSRFRTKTTIECSILVPGKVNIEISNIVGQKVKIFEIENHKAGFYQIQWDGKDDLGQNLASGVYVYRIQAEDFVQSRKLVVLH